MKMNNMKLIILPLATLLVILTITNLSAQAQPNVVIVFMDNFGWGEPGFNGGGITRGAATPRMDKIADEGLRLTNLNVEV
jgi:arylsulfatase